ncbi:hypothetical protein CA13_73820 [Planctomycetes bacterium CA13]|uniref:Uncharacterized protein n=1 Tax=Novipirellula herctigrandis TaxID=2527986 RepID=A0A5C5YLV7_9BACT|nr:hypothetical protein CA13_73820 [Planctomycetes bacterium CA13]
MGLPASSTATLVATPTVTAPSADALIVAAKLPLPLSIKLLAVPPPTVMSPISNPLTDSPKSIDTENGSLLVGMPGPVIVGVGVAVSTVTAYCVAAKFGFPAVSNAIPAAMSTVSKPSLAALIVIVNSPFPPTTKLLAVPPATVTSVNAKPLTVSPKSISRSNELWFVGLASPMMIGTSASVSSLTEYSAAARFALPAASSATSAATFTVTVPSALASIVAVKLPLALSVRLVTLPPLTAISPAVNPSTVSPKSIVTLNGSALVGVDGPLIIGFGAVVSMIVEY